MVTVEQYLRQYGFNYDGADPLADLYQGIINKVIGPVSNRNGANQQARNYIEASLRARYLLYYKKTPGDCSTTTSIGQSAGSLALKGTNAALGLAAPLLAGPAAPFVLGAELAIAPIEGLFQHHAHAVAKEQATLCAVCGQANQVIQNLDQAVAYNQMAPQDAIAAFENLAAQVRAAMQSITQNCNFACGINNTMSSQALLRAYTYTGSAASASSQMKKNSSVLPSYIAGIPSTATSPGTAAGGGAAIAAGGAALFWLLK